MVALKKAATLLLFARITLSTNADDVFSGTDTRIIGGSDVGLGEYPWFAKLTRGTEWAGCGGALVSPQFVLTAAHCIGDPIFNGAEIGALCQNPFTWMPNGNCGQVSQVISSTNILTHPDYNSSTQNNDFALVRLSSPATATPVTMDMNGLSETYTSNNKVWAIGFGNTIPDESSLPARMKHVEVSFVPDDTCNDMYFGRITENMMCAADPNEDSCQGDSGGPLYDKANGVLVGVTSWGFGCADPNYPGVYFKISSQWTWIKDIICNDNDSEKPGFCDVTPSVPTTASPVASPPPTISCTDTDGWFDSDGPAFDCEWYGTAADVNRCTEHGDSFANQGQTANEACCVCGGGQTGGSNPTRSPVTSSPTRNAVTASPTGKPVASPVASPVATPVANPVATPVANPVATPVASPVATPTSSDLCQDVHEKFQYTSTKKKHCKFVGKNNTAARCAKSGVKEACPVTCETGCKCFDTPGAFIMPSGNERTCSWAEQNTEARCRNFVTLSHCPIVCGLCDA